LRRSSAAPEPGRGLRPGTPRPAVPRSAQTGDPTFLPTTTAELSALGWESLDVILVSGDAYVDAPSDGIAVVGRVLASEGYRVGIIAQPDVHHDRDIGRLGEPRLFWGISAGAVDSMVANYTATRKRRRTDDMTPGGGNFKRPDRALIVYTNLIRRRFKKTRPIVIGGIEASLRRISHYDYWSDEIRRSVLFDAKADILVYGMGERAVVELADRLDRGQDFRSVRGLCYPSGDKPAGYLELPSHPAVTGDKSRFLEMFRVFYANADPQTARGLAQKQDTRYLVQNPPQPPLSAEALDRVYELPYRRELHPYYAKDGAVRALDTTRFSITSHRGCYGECSFCAIAVHQGRRVTNRSAASLLREAERLVKHPAFRGVITDVGGPTANMYGFECARKESRGACNDRRCLFPATCRHLPVDHRRQMDLLRHLRSLPGVKKVFVASGIRYDLLLNDARTGAAYLEQLLRHHVSGQMKIAPEHSEEHVLRHMGKPGVHDLRRFKAHFDAVNRKNGRKQYLTYYFLAAHPGCTLTDMSRLKGFVQAELHLRPEQVQIFTPTPSTWATAMYYTEIDPHSGGKLFVEKNDRLKERQKNCVVAPAKPAR
jgi:uncharacterized radical SAM protein YgiQ